MAASRTFPIILAEVAALIGVPTGDDFPSVLINVIQKAISIGVIEVCAGSDIAKLCKIAELMGVQVIAPDNPLGVVGAVPTPVLAATAAAAALTVAVVPPPPPAVVVPPVPTFPVEWAQFGDEHLPRTYAWHRRWQLVVLDRDSSEFAGVQDQLLESMQGVTVVRVERIQHRHQWWRFAAKCAELSLKCAGLGVVYNADLRLWHGTGATDPRTILSSETGLDERLASREGFYGAGVYLAEHARYSNGDAERGYFHADGASGHRQLLVRSSTVSTPHATSLIPRAARPPCKFRMIRSPAVRTGLALRARAGTTRACTSCTSASSSTRFLS